MSDINLNKIVGDKFEDMSVAEMSLVQGMGDVNVESTPTCAGAVSAIISILSGAIVSIAKC